jgi:hypothetical protein
MIQTSGLIIENEESINALKHKIYLKIWQKSLSCDVFLLLLNTLKNVFSKESDHFSNHAPNKN